MRSTKKLLDFYINSSVHVALAVVSLTIVTFFHFRIVIDLTLLLFIFFGSVTAYNFVKYANVAGLHHRSLTKMLRSIQVFSFLSFVGLVITLFFLEVKVLLWAGLLALFTLLYALPVFSRGRNLRSIPGVKVFIIAFVWAGATVALPSSTVQLPIAKMLAPEFLQRFLLVLVWILPFEIRDLKFDLKQLGTIPQRVGVTGTRVLATILLVLVLVIEFMKSWSGNAAGLALIVICIVSGLLVWKADEKQSHYFTAFWVEGVPLLWVFLLLLFRGI